MKRLFLISIIILLGLIGYSQTVTVHTTLLRIDGIEKGQLLIDKTLPIAWEYQFVITDTLDWTTIDMDNITVKDTTLLGRLDSLEQAFDNLLYKFNEAEKLNIKFNDNIMLIEPNLEMGW